MQESLLNPSLHPFLSLLLEEKNINNFSLSPIDPKFCNVLILNQEQLIKINPILLHLCKPSMINSHYWYICIYFFFQRHVVDFYISDFQSGLRALVKTGYGARVTPYVDESIVIDIKPENKEMTPEFHRWLLERNLSSDDRIMRLKEGYSCPDFNFLDFFFKKTFCLFFLRTCLQF